MTVQGSKDNIINLIGTIEGLMVSFTPTNADGTSNTAAQATAIQSTVAALVASGVFQVPTGVSLAAIQAFAPAMVAVLTAYLTATKKPEL